MPRNVPVPGGGQQANRVKRMVRPVPVLKHLILVRRGRFRELSAEPFRHFELAPEPWTDLLAFRHGSARQIGFGHSVSRPHHVTMDYGHITKTSRHVFSHHAAKPVSVGRWVVPVQSQVWEQKRQMESLNEHTNWKRDGEVPAIPSSAVASASCLSRFPNCLLLRTVWLIPFFFFFW